MRFALGADVPASKSKTVDEHLSAILGAAGKVEVLIQRSDGTKVLIERANGLARQIASLQELRKGLQTLTDARLIELKDSLQDATERRESVKRTSDRLGETTSTAHDKIVGTLAGQERTLGAASSALAAELKPIDDALDLLFRNVEAAAVQVVSATTDAQRTLEASMPAVETAYAAFLGKYQEQVAQLAPEQQALLESHREVLERTKALGSLEARQLSIRAELTELLKTLAEQCDRLAKALNDRTELRRAAVEQLNVALTPYDVRIQLKVQERSQEFQDMSARYQHGASQLGNLSSRWPAQLASLCLKSAYGAFAERFASDLGDVLFDTDIGYFVGAFENDDILISLKVGKAGEEYSPIDRLSAGQRCTAVFPILLEIGAGVLVVDQPEDNLDNRHIAGKIAPALLSGKLRRQMVFTSHNANLVVLSDAESIMMFESDGATGHLEEQGFFATSSSKIAPHVIDVLDGGTRALEMRSVKYGLGTHH